MTQQEQPNAETLAAFEAVERGEVIDYVSVDALYRSLGI